jgi:polar amino acid transport system substrate-binding protein
MRALPVLALVAALGLAVVGLGAGNPSHPVQLKGGCAKANLDLYADGKLSLATDNLSFPPWWGGKAGHGFDPSDPYSGKGYEGAVSYEVARRLGFAKSEVTWKPVGFNKAIAPGKKAYDAYISQVSYNPARAKAFDFSISYYFVNQAVVGLKGNPIAKVKTMKGLKPFRLGAPVGTTSYSYITRYIKPVSKPKVYDSVNDTIAALKAKQIDGFVVDFPSTGYITGVQLPTATVVGRLPTQGTRERFGLIFAKGATLDGCVSKALAAMRADGTLKRYESKWLAGTAPILK